MHTLRTLGAIGLTAEDGRESDALLGQPKRLALLAYLAAPEPGIWHRRDTLLGVFWPELDSGKARTSLRNALYVLRQQLGADALRTRGDYEVSLDPNAFQSDAGQLTLHAAAGRFAEGLALYRGEYLPGLYIRDADDFERWLDDERQRLKRLAVAAASRLSIERETAGDTPGAVAAQRRLLELEPADEPAARRLMALLDHAGDRGQALAAFDRLQSHLRSQFGAESSGETLRLAQEIRARRSPAPPPDTLPVRVPPPADEAGPPAPGPRPSHHRRRWWAAVAAALVVIGLTAYFSRPRPIVATRPTTLLVLPMTNGTGDPGDDYIAAGLTTDIARRLSTVRAFTIRATARADWPARIRDSLPLIGPAFGATVALRSRLTRVGDSLQAELQLVDVSTGIARGIGAERFVIATLRNAESQLAADIAGAVFRVPLPESPRASATPVDSEAYRLTMLGWHRLLALDDPSAARDLFQRATQADPSYPRAWSGLSSTWSAAAVNGLIPFDEGYARAEAAATRAIALDSLEGSAWANLGVLHALASRNLAAGEPYFRRAIAAEPANPEIFMVYASALRFARSWDRAQDAIRVSRRLDPLSAFYAEREANGAMCEGRAEEALRLYRAQVELDSRGRSGNLGVARALAALGRWDEAIAQLRTLARARGDTALSSSLASAHGEAGYWALRHAEGRALLQQREALASQGWVAPFLLGVADIGAGNLDRGMAILESEVRAGSRMVYKLPCNPQIDEIRSTPRYRRLLEAAGALPLVPASP
jgi:DNA-binding SARP family transcriptional activator/TolB-like protein